MINLLKAELFKLSRKKSIYICTAIMILFVVLSYGLIFMMSNIVEVSMGNVTISEEMTEADMEALSSLNLWDSLSILDVIQEMFGDVGVIIVTVFVVIFVIGEYGRGAIKNVVGKGYPRWKIFLSKYLAATLAAIGMLIVMEIAALLFGILFKGTGALKGEFWLNFFRYSGIQLLLAAALTGIVILICELFRNMGGAMSVSICLIVFSSLLMSVIDLLSQKLDFKVSDYWIMNLLANCPTVGMESSYVIRAVVSAVVWIAVVFSIGVLHFRKADIK